MIMEYMTMDEFSGGLDKTRSVIIPFGSLEEHGSHLPLGTDTVHAYELAKRVSRLHPVFIAPPVWYGLCRSTSRHPGTAGIRGNTLAALAEDLMASLYENGLRNMLLLSGHAGGTHMAALVNAAEKSMELLPELKVAVLSIIDLVQAAAPDLVETPGDSHAGEVETSLIQHLFPDLVKGTGEEEYPSFPRGFIVRDKRRFWPGGVWGNPRKASPAKGEEILAREAKALAGIMTELEKFVE